MICKNCKYYDGKNRICRNMKARYVGCEECYNANPKPTNADRIRAMSDDELAKFFDSTCIENMGSVRCDIGLRCYDCWLDWLKQEVDDG